MTIYGMKCNSGTYSSTMTHCNGTCMEFAFSLLLSFFLSAWIFSFSAFSASFTLFFSSFIFLLSISFCRSFNSFSSLRRCFSTSRALRPSTKSSRGGDAKMSDVRLAAIVDDGSSYFAAGTKKRKMDLKKLVNRSTRGQTLG